MSTSIRWAFRCGQWRPSADQWTMAMAGIQHEERNRINRFVFQRDAKAALVGRLLIRKSISDSLGIANKDITLDRTEHGKPFLSNGRLNFNISHQGEYVVIATESSCAVGIDTMAIERPVGSKSIPQFFSTMERQFTAEEWRAIRYEKSEHQQLANFYRLWCMKESYVKAIGVGIGFSLQRVDCCMTSPFPEVGQTISTSKIKIDGELLTDWTFEETMLSDNNIVCVAVNQELNEQRSCPIFKLLSSEELFASIQCLIPRQSCDSYWEEFNKKSLEPSLIK